MAKTVQSRKAKGRKAQQLVRDLILHVFPELTENDVRSTSMGASGDDILLSEIAQKYLPYSIEVKNQERLQIWAALEQMEQRATKTNKEGLLFFKRNHSNLYVALNAHVLLRMVYELSK